MGGTLKTYRKRKNIVYTFLCSRSQSSGHVSYNQIRVFSCFQQNSVIWQQDMVICEHIFVEKRGLLVTIEIG